MLDRETREIKTLKKQVVPHEVEDTGHDDQQESEEAQNFGIEIKPESIERVPKPVESVPLESENAESPDTVPGKPDVAEDPTISDEELPPDPPKISPNNKSFTYTHGPTIPDKIPERRTDWRRPDGWLPIE